MSRAAWAAIMTAIAFPTIALVIVILARPGPPPPRHGPPPPPPGAHHGPPPGGLHPEMLVKMRKPLELTDEQVDRIWDIIEPTRRRMIEIHAEIDEKEGQVRTLLETEDPDVKAVEALVEDVTGLHAERAKLEVLTPIKVRKVLTSEQRARLMELWKERPPVHQPGMGGGPPHPAAGKKPPRKQPPSGMHPPQKAPAFMPPPGKNPPQKQPPFPPPPGAEDPPPPPKAPNFQ